MELISDTGKKNLWLLMYTMTFAETETDVKLISANGTMNLQLFSKCHIRLLQKSGMNYICNASKMKFQLLCMPCPLAETQT